MTNQMANPTATTTVCVYLWTRSPIFDLAGVEALLVGVFHAGKDSRAAEAHWVDGTLVMEQHSVCDDLEKSPKLAFVKTHLVVTVSF